MNRIYTLYHLIFIVKIKNIMKVCILGNGLTSLTLAKTLVNKGIYVDVLSDKNFQNFDKLRTIGISKSNIEYFNKYILDIRKLIWKINKIEVFSENLINEKILDFKDYKKQLFAIVKNYELSELLISKLKKNKFVKFKKNISVNDLIKNNYGLVINCDSTSSITKKFFYKKINKIYNSYAYSTIIKHKKLSPNNIATQIFTSKGPIAFLPISETETSLVYSVNGHDKIDLKYLIKKFNKRYSIIKMYDFIKIELKSMNLRSYRYKNVLAFGDLLHRLHPLAGQGFNMSIRDIQSLMDIISERMKNGLEINSTICVEFEKKNKSRNYVFSQGIDFIHEFFNFESKFNNPIISKSLKVLGKNKKVNDFFIKIADKGIVF